MADGSRVAVAAAAAVLAAGCGGATDVQERAATGPPEIEAVDEPVSPELEQAYRALNDKLPANLNARPEQRAFLESIAPARDAELRVVARLPLHGARVGVVLDLVAWRSVDGGVCTLTTGRSRASVDLGGVGPNGPCVRPDACEAVCVDEGYIEIGETQSSVLAGTVAPEADELRVELFGGGRTVVPLTGPLLTGFDGRRVVLFDLGRTSATRLELLRDGVVVASRAADDTYDYATDDCMNAALAAPTGPERERRARDCV